MKKQILFLLIIIFSLEISAQSITDTVVIDEVVFTGSRVKVSRKNMPINVSVLNKAEINEVEESAVLPVLSRKIPGMFVSEIGVTGFGAGPSSAGQISIRGVGGNPNTQVLMLVDGQPQYMGIFGHPLPNSYVASDLERVEVIKGPGSILYGSNAMGGVVNFITKKPENDGFTANARIAYGSYNTQKYMVNGGFKKNGLHVFASLNRDVTDGHRDSSEFEINNTYLKAGYDVNRHIEVVADFNIAKFNSADPGRNFENISAFRAEIMRGKTSFTVKNNFKGLEGGIYAYYNFGEHELSDGWFSNDENYGISIYEGIALPWNSLLTLGADNKIFGGKGNGGAAANIWNTENETGVYAIVRHEILKVVNISYGLRLEDHSIYGNELIPQGGISWRASDATTLKASVSKGFRSPTIMETYLFLPNPSLEPERLMNYELSASQQLLQGKLNADISIFMLEGTNIIQVRPNNSPPPLMQRVNVGAFSNKGFEVELNYLPNKILSSALSYSYLNLEEPLLAAPEHQLYAGINYRLRKLDFALQGHFVGGLYTDVSIENSKAEYLLLNASVKYKPLQLVELFISGKNLLDQRYQIINGYPMPGLHFMLGVNFSI